MTEKEFLTKVEYSVSESKKKLYVWFENKILAEIDFSDNPHRLYDDSYCKQLAEEVALESFEAEKLIKYDTTI